MAPKTKAAKSKTPKTRAPKMPRIVYGANFKTHDDGEFLDTDLLDAVTKFCQHLIDNDLVTGNIVFNQGVRARATAHRWSTSWNLRRRLNKRAVLLKNLQELEDGKDLDGNQWYDPAWEEGLDKDSHGRFTKESLKQLWDKIEENAKDLYSSNAIAAEGYALKDKRSKPNIHPVVSNHVGGHAMDVSIPWKIGALIGDQRITSGETDDPAVQALVEEFGLSRPVPSERWHFQLATTAHFNVASDNIQPKHPKTEVGHP